MDMTGYGGDSYLTLADLRASGPLQTTITKIEEGQFDKPVASLADGSNLQLNVSNTRRLIKAWGPNSDDWLGREIAIAVEQVDYKGEPTDAIVVTPISATIPIEARKPSTEPDLSDEIPF
jgi:hypothetical protein